MWSGLVTHTHTQTIENLYVLVTNVSVASKPIVWHLNMSSIEKRISFNHVIYLLL